MGYARELRPNQARHPAGPSLFDVIETESPASDVCRALEIGPLTAGWPDHFASSLREELAIRKARPIRALSLFTGAGGLDLGFHDAGFELAEMVEIDRRCVTALQANCGAGRLLGGATARCLDVRQFEPSRSSGYEFILGGPPCQSFSAAGRRASGVPGINDARGTLFAEYVRILTAVRPAGFLFENVYGITGANNGAAWRDIQEAFRAAGYRLFCRILDTADYGVPQHRERLIIVGVREGEFRFPRRLMAPTPDLGGPTSAHGTAVAAPPWAPTLPPH